MPGFSDSGLLVVRLPARSASERIREQLSGLQPRELPSTPSGIYSLANLANLARPDPRTTESAVAFLGAHAPAREQPAPFKAGRARAPADLLPPVRRLRLSPLLIGLGLLAGLLGGAALLAWVLHSVQPAL